MRRFFFINFSFLTCATLVGASSETAVAQKYDIVIYGGTGAGVMAAIQAKKLGKSVVLIEPTRHLGGMTSSGLGWVDAKNSALFGGLTRKYFHKVWKYYQNPNAWKWECSHTLHFQHGKNCPKEYTMWVLEPHVAERIFNEMAKKADVCVVFNEQLKLKEGVIKKNKIIQKILMESGQLFEGRIFIDATYEGDLMAAAGVSYTFGRESNNLYNETLNGVQPHSNPNSMLRLIDPYVIPQDPSSGLLPRIYPSLDGIRGEGDRGIQAYNYRMCLTDVEENKIPIEKPENYEEKDYEMVFRAIESGRKERFFKLSMLPNRKTDSNNNGPLSTDYVGMNQEYIDAGYKTRKQIALQHKNWQLGLIWTLQNHPRVPDKLRAYYTPWGLSKDEFIDNEHWPYLLYVREGRRMVSSYVITEHTAIGKEQIKDSIGIATYPIDSHFVKYFISNEGILTGDGYLFKVLPDPFPVSYQAIVPKREECQNLLVPVCLSSSHVAYGSIRMEPVFMNLGQTAGTAACLAIKSKFPVQDVPYFMLRQQMIADQQVLYP